MARVHLSSPAEYRSETNFKTINRHNNALGSTCLSSSFVVVLLLGAGQRWTLTALGKVPRVVAVPASNFPGGHEPRIRGFLFFLSRVHLKVKIHFDKFKEAKLHASFVVKFIVSLHG